MDDNLTISTLNDALLLYGKPEIFNSDQGSQYTAKKFIDTLLNNDVAISMDSKGRAIDNIFMERFWRTIKYEEIYPSGYLNIKEARVGIEKYIHKYNNLRLPPFGTTVNKPFVFSARYSIADFISAARACLIAKYSNV